MKKIIFATILTSSLLFSYTMDYDRNTKCVVRKVQVYKDPQWVAKIELANGKKLFFCSPKSMIEFYQQPGRWSNLGIKSESDFKDVIVTDYKTLKPVDARGAFFVYGSNKISLAGDDLVAFEKYSDAKDFASKNNGKRIFSLSEVPEGLIKLLNGKI